MIMFNVNCYNVDIAKAYGVLTAVMLSFIDKSYEYALRQGNLNKNKTFSMSRTNIYHATGLKKEEQENIEKVLTNYNIIDILPFRDDSDRVYYIYNQEKVAETTRQLQSAQNMKDLIDVMKVAPKESVEKTHRISKREKEIQTLKSSIKEEDSVLKSLIFDWIDAIYNRNFSITTAAMKINLNQINNYDTDTKVKILHIAIKNGYRDIQWAVEAIKDKSDRNWKSYEDMQPTTSTVLSKETF